MRCKDQKKELSNKKRRKEECTIEFVRKNNYHCNVQRSTIILRLKQLTAYIQHLSFLGATTVWWFLQTLTHNDRNYLDKITFLSMVQPYRNRSGKQWHCYLMTRCHVTWSVTVCSRVRPLSPVRGYTGWYMIHSMFIDWFLPLSSSLPTTCVIVMSSLWLSSPVFLF